MKTENMKNVENVKLSQNEEAFVVDLAHKVNAELTPEKLAELSGTAMSREDDCFVDYHEKIDNLKLSAKGVSCMNGQTAGQIREAVLRYVQKTMGDWGYSEAYVQSRFDEAMAESCDAFVARYDACMGKLKAGETDEFDVSPEELPAVAVGKFAAEFRDGFQSCIMASAA